MKSKPKPTEPKDDEPKAEGDAQAAAAAVASAAAATAAAFEKDIKNADAIMLSAFGSPNSKPGRRGIQGKCQLADGSLKTIGVI